MRGQTLLYRAGVAIITSLLMSSFPFPPFVALAQKVNSVEIRRSGAAPPGFGFHAIANHPSNTQKIYLSTEIGLRLSEDGGLSWRSLVVGGKDEESFALAVDPTNPDTLYVGRRDGLWKSNNGGSSWDTLPYPGSVPLSVAIDENEPDTVYLSTSRQGLHKSTNGGRQWKDVSRGLPEAGQSGRVVEIHSLAVDRRDSNIVYAAISGHGVYRTVDGGLSWHQFNKGVAVAILQSVFPPKLGFDSVNPSRLYLAFNQRIHSHLLRTRLFVLSANNDEWLPVEVELPPSFPVLGLVVEGARNVQLWGSYTVWEVYVPEAPVLEK